MNSKMKVSFFAVVLFAVCGTLAFSVVDLGALAQNTNSSTTTEASMQNTNDASEAQETAGGEQADLSGTYTGRMRMSGGHDMAGQVTLTITGNSFTLEGEGMNHPGRVYAVTTRGYTGASFFFSDLTDSTTNTPIVASVRARKTTNRLSLTPVPGSRTKLTFTGTRQ